MFSFTITTLGCKVNQYETQSLITMLSQAGGNRVPSTCSPDVCVINTCCITTTAARKSRQAIRKFIRKNPESRIMILGCYSDYNPEQINDMLVSMELDPKRCCVAGHHDDLAGRIDSFLRDVVDNKNNEELSPDLESTTDCQKAGSFGSDDPYYIKPRRSSAVKNKAPGTRFLPSIKRFENHQRAFVKIQDGCDAFCTYCVVPYTRANVWSRDIDSIVEECQKLVYAGHREIVLTGVFIGAFARNTSIRKRWDRSPSKLPQLINRITEIPDLWKVRLSSLEPGDVTDELIEVFQGNPKVAPHLHLPLQSGSPKILKKMNRQYTPAQFRNAVNKLRDALDNPAITADIIVGFPTETDDDFKHTLQMAEDCEFCKIHAFPFSPNPGTAAWLMRNDSPAPSETKKRMDQLAKLESKLAEQFRSRFIGKTMQGIVESTIPEKGCRQAMTDRYLTVKFAIAGSPQLTGQVVNLKILEIIPDGLYGDILNQS